MRYKGNFSLMMGSLFSPDGKLSFRLNFDRFEDAHPEIANQRFYGFKELTFSSNFDDASRMREALANEIFRDRGVAAPRVAFYRIVVNTGTGDESWGLYTLVEDPADPAMLASQFGGASGNLYKPDGPGADWTTFDRAGFEKKTNKATADFSDIQAAIEALHADLPAAAWRANLERHFDVDVFLRWLAVNQVVDNWDAYGRFAHNYYLYADPGRNGRLVWIPWDNNYSFGLIPFVANLAGMSPAWCGACAPRSSGRRRPDGRIERRRVVRERWGGLAADLQAPGGSRLHAALSRAPEIRARRTLRAGQACRSNPRVADAAGFFSEVGQARVDVWRNRRLPDRDRHPADCGGPATLAHRSRSRSVRLGGVRSQVREQVTRTTRPPKSLLGRQNSRLRVRKSEQQAARALHPTRSW